MHNNNDPKIPTSEKRWDKSYTVHREPPGNFSPTVQVAGCFCEWNHEILLLQRSNGRPQAGTWNIPAGKAEKGETSLQTVVREVQEELGIALDPKNLSDVGVLYITIPGIHYVFHMYYSHFIEEPKITLDLTEHDKMKWMTPFEALRLPLIMGGEEVLYYFLLSPFGNRFS